MTDTMECHLMCRLCLVKEQVNIPIFEEQGNLHTLQKITTCLPLKVTREDRLPKSICDGCNFKLDQQYQFWNTSVNAEKQLKSWLGIVDDPPPKVKKEKEVEEVPVSKRPRRNARRKAAANARKMAAIPSDSDDDNRDFDSGHTVAKEEAASDVEYNENDSLEPTTFVNVSLQDPEQAGPSGVQKSGGGSSSAPATATSNTEAGNFTKTIKEETIKEEDLPDATHWISELLNEGNASGKRKHRRKNDDESDADTYDFQGIVNDGNSVDKTKPKRKYVRRKVKTENEDFYGNLQADEQITDFINKVQIEESFIQEADGFRCKTCNKVCQKKSHCKLHYLKHVKIKPFTCNICNKKFKAPEHVRLHKKNKHSGTRKIYCCDVCSWTSISEHYYKVHINTHLNIYPFACSECDKKYTTKNFLEKHIESKHKGMRYECDICQKTFAFQADVTTHKKRTHDPTYIPPQFQCDMCDKIYHSKTHLKRHKESHQGFTCEICGLVVAFRTGLQRHMLTHTGAKPLTCKFCGKSFASSSTLGPHMRIHTGEKPHECTVCGKRFNQRSPLVIHMRGHTGERPYKCTHCTEAFISRAVLNMHLQKYHLIVK